MLTVLLLVIACGMLRGAAGLRRALRDLPRRNEDMVLF